jgi:thymidylate synthase
LKQYYELLQNILDNGNVIENDRTGTGTLSLFGKHLDFDLKEGFPLLTGKFTSFKMVANELLWFLSGSTNNEDLRKLNGNDKPTIWEEWALEKGELGPIYGKQMRDWNGIDQIAVLIEGLKNKPFSRRHIVSCWNVSDLPDESISPQENVMNGKAALPACHTLFQFYVRKLSFEERVDLCHDCVHVSIMHQDEYSTIMDGLNVPKYGLSCHLYCRSQDLLLGAGYNYASYALLTHMIANLTNMIPDILHISYGDVHLYKNHIEQTHELLSRDLELYQLPKLEIDKKYSSIDDFTLDSFNVIGYNSHPRIYAPIAV